MSARISYLLLKFPIYNHVVQGRKTGVSLSKLNSLTSFSPSGPVHSQEPFGHRMINDRIFLSVALSGKVSYEQRQAERQDRKNNFMNKKNNIISVLVNGQILTMLQSNFTLSTGQVKENRSSLFDLSSLQTLINTQTLNWFKLILPWRITLL